MEESLLQEYSTRPAYNEEQVCRDTVTFLDNLVAKIKYSISVYAAKSLLELLSRESSPSGRLQFYQTWGRPFGLASECPNLPQFCEYATMQVWLTISSLSCVKNNFGAPMYQ